VAVVVQIYATGLPSFNLLLISQLSGYFGVPAAAINPALAAMGNITGYGADIAFEGSSIYLAGQFNVSYVY